MTDLDALLARARLTAGHGAPVLLPPAEALALVDEVERLRGERAAVVAWLRDRVGMYDGELRSDEAVVRALQYLADDIERGEHRREEAK